MSRIITEALEPRLLLAAGALDRSFGNGNVQLFDSISQVVVQPDGKLLVDGYVDEDPSNEDAIDSSSVARLNPDGSIDRSFGDNGFKTFSAAGYGSSIALAPDGKILYADPDGVRRLLPGR